ncbi:MAG: hypothetical protein JWR12_2620 [Mucilaginibacter sp.]|nr:hypothetical protein [Mucilaginibacter sp.]
MELIMMTLKAAAKAQAETNNGEEKQDRRSQDIRIKTDRIETNDFVSEGKYRIALFIF